MKTQRMSKKFGKEMEDFILKNGYEIRRVGITDNIPLFSVYECNDERVRKNNKPILAIFGHTAAFRIADPKSKQGDNELLLVGYNKKEMNKELAELCVAIEDQLKEIAA